MYDFLHTFAYEYHLNKIDPKHVLRANFQLYFNIHLLYHIEFYNFAQTCSIFEGSANYKMMLRSKEEAVVVNGFN